MPEEKPTIPIRAAAADHLLFWCIAVAGIASDLISKRLIFDWLQNRPDAEYTVIPGFFNLQLQINTGAAFGIATGRKIMLVSISIIAIAVVLWIFRAGRSRHWPVKIALPLFLAGIVGNLYDRLTLGYVRDFIDWYYAPLGHWPTFNLADSMLCIAVALIVLSSFLYPGGKKEAS